MKRISIPLALVFSLALPVIAYASMDKGEEGHSRIEKMFERHDANKDGKITQDEMSEGRHKFLRKIRREQGRRHHNARGKRGTC